MSIDGMRSRRSVTAGILTAAVTRLAYQFAPLGGCQRRDGRDYLVTARRTARYLRRMKNFIATTGFLAVIGLAGVAYASATLRYYNEDSKDYTWKATCSGSEYSVTFDHSKTSSVTIQGSTPCTIHAPNGDVKITGDAKVHIKDGKLTVE